MSEATEKPVQVDDGSKEEDEKESPPIGKLIKRSSLAHKIKNPNYVRTDREKTVEEQVNFMDKLLHEQAEAAVYEDDDLGLSQKCSIKSRSGEDSIVIAPESPAVADKRKSLLSKQISNVLEQSTENLLGQPKRRMSIIAKQYLNDMVQKAMSSDIVFDKEWTFWLDANTKKGTTETDFLNTLHNLESFKTSQMFSYIMMTYCDYLINIDELTVKLNNRIFRTGITPIREDPQNEFGGQYIAMLPKSRAAVQHIWFQALVTLIMGKLDVIGEVTGIVLSLRRKGDSIGIWVKTRCHSGVSAANKQAIRTELGLPENSKITYNNHKIGGGHGYHNDHLHHHHHHSHNKYKSSNRQSDYENSDSDTGGWRNPVGSRSGKKNQMNRFGNFGSHSTPNSPRVVIRRDYNNHKQYEKSSLGSGGAQKGGNFLSASGQNNNDGRSTPNRSRKNSAGNDDHQHHSSSPRRNRVNSFSRPGSSIHVNSGKEQCQQSPGRSRNNSFNSGNGNNGWTSSPRKNNKGNNSKKQLDLEAKASIQ